jgi:hypothetical protein
MAFGSNATAATPQIPAAISINRMRSKAARIGPAGSSGSDIRGISLRGSAAERGFVARDMLRILDLFKDQTPLLTSRLHECAFADRRRH